jgi:hypothetical protein
VGKGKQKSTCFEIFTKIAYVQIMNFIPVSFHTVCIYLHVVFTNSRVLFLFPKKKSVFNVAVFNIRCQINIVINSLLLLLLDTKHLVYLLQLQNILCKYLCVFIFKNYFLIIIFFFYSFATVCFVFFFKLNFRQIPTIAFH